MPRFRTPSLFLVTLLWVAVAGPGAAATVYRWVDEDGVTHFGQNPPSDRPAQRVDVAAPPPDDPAAARERTERSLESAGDRAYRERLEREEAQRLRASRDERERWCADARQDRRELLERARVRNAEEGYAVMSAAEREARAEKLQREIQRRCRD